MSLDRAIEAAAEFVDGDQEVARRVVEVLDEAGLLRSSEARTRRPVVTDLPGMWEYADFTGGSDDPGPAEYWKKRAERAEAELATVVDPLPIAADAAVWQERAERAEAEVEELRDTLWDAEHTIALESALADELAAGYRSERDPRLSYPSAALARYGEARRESQP